MRDLWTCDVCPGRLGKVSSIFFGGGEDMIGVRGDCDVLRSYTAIDVEISNYCDVVQLVNASIVLSFAKIFDIIEINLMILHFQSSKVQGYTTEQNRIDDMKTPLAMQTTLFVSSS